MYTTAGKQQDELLAPFIAAESLPCSVWSVRGLTPVSSDSEEGTTR
jgi:hypothetical protein